MSRSHMPPVPPANRSPKGVGGGAEARKGQADKGGKAKNLEEEGETANVRENTTNAGFFQGRRK